MRVSVSSPPRLHSPFVHSPVSFTPSSFRLRSPAASYPRIKAEVDTNTVVAISVGVASVALGIGIPVFYETQIDNAAKRENTQPCFPCNGTGARMSLLSLFQLLKHFCMSKENEFVMEQRNADCVGSGNVTVELGGGEKEVSNCINCDGAVFNLVTLIEGTHHT
ncbi:hypothetical protein Bca52824_024932 [Brassica carinata]|uniref:Uncharacterized protein n=1 Tax=Brassica carinata TaxID=52824 RepID=A0A8X8AV72_BRACI|nr:hypothetical protein Bca52824_024932 [Brassica carinata]